MSAPKYTPGPWTVEDTELSDLTIVAGDHGWVADVDLAGVDLAGMIGKATSAANARLIAAVPDLLDACLRVLEQIDNTITADTIDALNAAVVKAQGRV